MLIVLGVLMLIGLVILHELGHFWAARRAGIEVEEFGIGFPPKAKSLGKKNGTEYTLNWLPLGGFVKLKGEHDSDTTKGSFGAAKLSDKIRVMVAGVIMNIITAAILLSIISLFGLPQAIDGQFNVASDSKKVRHEVVVSVAKESPSAMAGLQSGDIVKSLDIDDGEVLIEKAEDIRNVTESLAGQTIVVNYTRDNQPALAEVTLNTTEAVEESVIISKQCTEQAEFDGSEAADCPVIKGYLGVVPDDYIERQATWSAPIVGVVSTAQYVGATFEGLGGIFGDLFRGDTAAASEQTTGVVGIGYILGELSSRGFMSVLFLTALISISLAVMNILPIPALDGGRLFVTLLFRAIRKPLNKDTEERIHGTGFALLMVLFFLITIVDVQRFIIN